ncbi:hypothetical protein [Bradyrhizobium sp. B120]|uniref:hypothetical protein n=1 Tax=Bradyrhizobium sp. B120 TaxID=3410088 RepID=UPI003B984495
MSTARDPAEKSSTRMSLDEDVGRDKGKFVICDDHLRWGHTGEGHGASRGVSGGIDDP